MADNLLHINSGVASDTRIVTENGIGTALSLYNIGTGTSVAISEIIAEKFSVNVAQESSNVFRVGEQPTITLQTVEGFELTVSKNHYLYTDSDEWVKASELEEGDKVQLLDHYGLFGNHGTQNDGIIEGLLAENDVVDFESRSFTISFENITSASSIDVHKIYDWVATMEEEGGEHVNTGLNSVSPVEFQVAIDQTNISRDHVQGIIPDNIYTGSKEMVRGFLQAIVELRGNITNPEEGTIKLNLYGDTIAYLQNIQQLLLNFGVKSSLEELPEDTGRLIIESESVVQFMENIGTLSSQTEFGQEFQSMFEEQHDELVEEEEEYLATISSIEESGTIEVYNLVEPNTMTYIANGIVVHC